MGRSRARVVAPPPGEEADAALCGLLRSGDEDAFRSLVERHQASLVRVVSAYVPSRAVAEEVVQEVWVAVIRGVDRFEGRSSLRTWIFRIAVNRARTSGRRERRSTPVSSLRAGEEPAVPADRFLESGHRWAGHWAAPPGPWSDGVADIVDDADTRAVVMGAIEALPPRQREVMALRDVEGWSGPEVCELLGLSEGNQRVLLHRARSRVRLVLEGHLGEGRTGR